MHSFNGGSCIIHYDGDFDGEVIICNKNDNTEIRIDIHDLINFVSEYVRNKKISQLENMSTNEVLGAKWKKFLYENKK